MTIDVSVGTVIAYVGSVGALFAAGTAFAWRSARAWQKVLSALEYHHKRHRELANAVAVVESRVNLNERKIINQRKDLDVLTTRVGTVETDLHGLESRQIHGL